jgi:hypothetical protein
MLTGSFETVTAGLREDVINLLRAHPEQIQKVVA